VRLADAGLEFEGSLRDVIDEAAARASDEGGAIVMHRPGFRELVCVDSPDCPCRPLLLEPGDGRLDDPEALLAQMEAADG
jgi:hypothetical protein